MNGLVRAEMLKIRRRQATYVLLIVELVLAGLIFLTTGPIYVIPGIIEFPAAYSLFKEAAFGLGGLIAIVFAAAFVGADWNWGVLRNVVARGESRERYLLAKALGVAIALLVAMLLVFAASFVFTYMQGWIYGIPVANPFRGDGLQDLVEWLVFGYPVLLQRAAIGLAVAVVVRSQLAGAVVGIVLFLVESTVTTILTVLTFGSRFVDGGFDGGFQPVGPEWFQYLPISIGGNVFNALPGAGGVTSSGDIQNLFLRPVPFEIAMAGVLVYLVGALAVALVALRRQEIV
jgi:ABC-type transport system involved in multi-copper enzyme maturation permease subunit